MATPYCNTGTRVLQYYTCTYTCTPTIHSQTLEMPPQNSSALPTTETPSVRIRVRRTRTVHCRISTAATTTLLLLHGQSTLLRRARYCNSWVFVLILKRSFIDIGIVHKSTQQTKMLLVAFAVLCRSLFPCACRYLSVRHTSIELTRHALAGVAEV